MDKVANLFHKLTVIALFFMMVACSSIKIVAIKNSTDETVAFSGKFVYETNAPYNLVFTLNPGENNLWQYEIGYFEEKTLDKGLSEIILRNDSGCKVLLDRDAIEKIAKKQGQWMINIDETIMNCN